MKFFISITLFKARALAEKPLWGGHCFTASGRRTNSCFGCQVRINPSLLLRGKNMKTQDRLSLFPHSVLGFFFPVVYPIKFPMLTLALDEVDGSVNKNVRAFFFCCSCCFFFFQWFELILCLNSASVMKRLNEIMLSSCESVCEHAGFWEESDNPLVKAYPHVITSCHILQSFIPLEICVHGCLISVNSCLLWKQVCYLRKDSTLCMCLLWKIQDFFLSSWSLQKKGW